MSRDTHPIILFDGVCNFCNASVNFILKRDTRGTFRFAPLQSQAGRDLLSRHGLPTDDFDSMVLIEGDRAFRKSTAILRIVRRLGGAWPVLYPLIVLPRFLRDAGYDLIARNRYRWFGRRETCRMPTEEERERFVS